MKFDSLGLSEVLQKSIAQAGYHTPTQIQLDAIPRILAGGDMIASAQTGTGKTAAFALPILHKLSQKKFTKVRPIRALVLAPTRELVSQVGASFKKLGECLVPKLRCIEVFGGVKIEAQEHKLKLGCDILVATPGRLLDLIGQGTIRLSMVEFLVLDEGDRLLEMGFMPDLKRICAKLPQTSQKLMFSATFTDDVDRLAAFLLRKPERLAPETSSVVLPKIRQVVHNVESNDKIMALRSILVQNEASQILVFVNTRIQAADLAHALGFASFNVACLHGDVDQKTRTKVLADFLSGEVRILIATDVAARGLHIPDLPLVVNYELPTNTDDYIHRIGRTGRSGKAGRAVSLVSQGEMVNLGYIEELIGEKIIHQKIPGFKVSQEDHRKRKDDVLAKIPSRRKELDPYAKRKLDPRNRAQSEAAPRKDRKAPSKNKAHAPGGRKKGKRK